MENGKHYLLPIINNSGFKKVWIAEQVGLSKSQLSHYLHGTRPMPIEIEKGLKTILRLD